MTSSDTGPQIADESSIKERPRYQICTLVNSQYALRNSKCPSNRGQAKWFACLLLLNNELLNNVRAGVIQAELPVRVDMKESRASGAPWLCLGGSWLPPVSPAPPSAASDSAASDSVALSAGAAPASSSIGSGFTEVTGTSPSAHSASSASFSGGDIS